MALAAERATPKQAIFMSFALPVETNVIIYAGSIVQVKATGYASPASNSATSNVVMGVAKHTVDNRTVVGGAHPWAGTAGQLWVEVECGIFQFAATSISVASIGVQMMVVDDQTFDETGTNSVECGVCVGFTLGSTTEGKIFIAPGGFI